MRSPAERAVDAIIDDLVFGRTGRQTRDRRGLRREWDQLSVDNRTEIRDAWIAIVEKWVPGADEVQS